MDLKEFDYILPENLIAQSPLRKRDGSKLLVYNKKKDTVEHRLFHEIIEYLDPGDVLVFNDTKVFKARLFGKKSKTSGKVEVLLLSQDSDLWSALIRCSGKLKINDEIIFENNIIATVIDKNENGIYFLKFNIKLDFEKINEIGSMPLPPYINRQAVLSDDTDYQTVYAQRPGAIAAPTAGFHFTNELISKVKEKGIEVLFVTLHISWATFKPIKTTDISKHKMHTEWYEISQDTADKLNRCKGKIYAVGTTCVRVLEYVAAKEAGLKKSSGFTDFYICPGYKFKVINGVITNFHMPRSTLLVLISAFIGMEKRKELYELAKMEQYRFLSYGDAMFLWE